MMQDRACLPKPNPNSTQRLRRQADLHIHTNFSDGTFSPQEVVANAERLGLSAIAITDHDTTDAIEPAVQSAKDTSLEIVPGIEFTTETEGREVHMLGFFIEHKAKWLGKELQSLRHMRIKRMQKMLDRLSDLKIYLEMQDVKNVSGEGSLGRLHLATALFNKGCVKTVQEAFDKFIGFGKPCYVSGDRISPLEAISIIIKASGIPVLAHPYTIGKDELIPKFIKAGLRGIEVYHSDHNEATFRHYKKIAEDFGLLVTGGSDCHGMGKGRMLMGTVTVPYELVERLKNAR